MAVINRRMLAVLALLVVGCEHRAARQISAHAGNDPDADRTRAIIAFVSSSGAEMAAGADSSIYRKNEIAVPGKPKRIEGGPMI
jgi:hypothetical protein